MGKHSLRTDKTCLNCHHVVENRFCPNCGQENKETKESFYYLFIHTIEDLVHYDSGFWKTIKYLLFYPGKLSKEYIAGRRKMYVPPVKLYIFISFITFFILSIFTSINRYSETPISVVNKEKQSTKTDNVRFSTEKKSAIQIDTTNINSNLGELKGSFGEWLNQRARSIAVHAQDEHFVKEFYKTLFNSIPKTLFLYMPLFAFVVWLFHDKKKWYYFDSGIYTIHYFSMILLSFTINQVLTELLYWLFGEANVDTLTGFMAFGLMMWWFFYFFRSHRIFFQEKRWVSRLKGIFIFSINLVLLMALIISLLAYSALNVN
ncbi:MAG TPA: DUF3667 domain-containing protein [Flavobacterium sp.]|nr:DUF3667 domain-containing protein [Flavobacterium sp.]